MWLGWLHLNNIENPIFLCRSMPVDFEPRLDLLWGEGLSFNQSELEKKSKASPFYAACVNILKQNRSLEIKLLPSPSIEPEKPDFLLELLEHTAQPLALQLLSSWRFVNYSDAINIVIIDKDQKIGADQRLSTILAQKFSSQSGILICAPELSEIRSSGRKIFNTFEALRKKKSPIHLLYSSFYNAQTPSIAERIWHFDSPDALARDLEMLKLDEFRAKNCEVSYCPGLTWSKAREMFTGIPLSTPEDEPENILTGSLLDQALTREHRNKLILPGGNKALDHFCHLILRGTSGTGKTSLGHLILLNELARDDQARVVYMGPTRMLVEERWEVFKKEAALYSGTPLGLNPSEIVISTGERTEDDARILNGDFRALFIVYEKLNNFFHNSRFVKSLSCVLVDEIQMIADPIRGGVLEVILSRLRQEAGRRLSERKKLLRLVICTTESFNLHDMLTISIRPKNSLKKVIRPPLELNDFRRPTPIRHYYQYLGKGRQTMPILLDIQDKRIVQNNATTWRSPVPSVIPVKNEKEIWLKEWLWGRKKVVYIATDVQAMLQLAEKLLPSRRIILDDKEWLGQFSEALKGKLEENAIKRMAVCAQKGIFFCFTDMGSKARIMASTKFCELKDPMPIVTFATSAVMYGINVPADMLILANSLFWPHKEIKPFGLGRTVLKHLSASQLHNFVGRVGRLGLSDADLTPLVIINGQLRASETTAAFRKSRSEFTLIEENIQQIHDLLSRPDQKIKTNIFRNYGKNSLRSLTHFDHLFLLNALLHLVSEKDEPQTADQILDFIQTTWSGRNLKAEVWKEEIPVFFSNVQAEHKNIVIIEKTDEEEYYSAGPLLKAICETSTPLMTLSECRYILANWPQELLDSAASPALAILSICLFSETWSLFLDFFLEGQKRFEKLTDSMEVYLKDTPIHEEEVEKRLQDYLGLFMGAQDTKKVIAVMRNLAFDKNLDVDRHYGIPDYARPRIICMLLRMACALFAWCLNEDSSKINRCRYPEGELPNSTDGSVSIFDNFLDEKIRRRIYYSLCGLKAWSTETEFPHWAMTMEQLKTAMLDRNLLP